ncbi:hypothetical protein [Aureimonas psammosilenae]|uniref:hypothetical protein n=1 Tax=Aureimonas psammosilenae TaxID=2495496 RepID=UPI001260C122|nr:hypothetical protein [Aureimonas psammosilenae]
MSAVFSCLARLDRRYLGLIAAGLVLALAILDQAAVIRGLFAGFLVLLAVPTGATLLLLIHRLTGGEWGKAARPALGGAALLLPAVSLLALPALLLPGDVFRWIADPSTIRHEDVAHWYLNAPGLVLRSALTLGLWNVLALLAALAPHRLSKALAGLGLLLFGLTVSTAAMDWVLLLDPRFKSTAFAMSWSLAFLLAGAGWVAASGVGGKATGDIAKLLVTFALGLLYLDLMQFLVAYDGNLPDQAAWYLRRATPFGVTAIGLVFVSAALLPFVASLKGDWRNSARIQRIVGISAILGTALRTLWWTAPEWQPGPVFWASVLLSGVVALGLAQALGRARIRGGRLHAV